VRGRRAVRPVAVEELLMEESNTPSMDDKHIPSPPTRTVEQYEADKERGINPVGKPTDKKGIAGG
jgi:hypothetical protein